MHLEFLPSDKLWTNKTKVSGRERVPESDEFIPLSQLAKYIPFGRNGRKRHVSSIYRYAKRGVRGIRLLTWHLPDGQYTTLAAWKEFVEKLSSASQPNPLPQSDSIDTISTQQKSVEAAIDIVRRSIRHGRDG